MIRRHNERWRRFFSSSGITPAVVTYEDALSDPQRVVDRLLPRVGVVRSGLPVRPITRQQRNEVNAAWLDRYRRDCRWRLLGRG